MALVPLLLVAALGADWLIPSDADRALRQRRKMKAKRDYRRTRFGLLGIAFLLLVVNSWSWALVADAWSNGAANNETQQGILTAMSWMNATIPPGSRIVSVTDSDLNYYQLLYGRASGYAPLATPGQVAASTSGSGIPTYVVLTQVGTVNAPDPGQNPFNLYPSDTRFTLEYDKGGVFVYKFGS